MKIETQPTEDQQVRLTVELEPEVMAGYMRQAAREISLKARVPGFRPGKVPFDVIKRVFGEKAIEEQAIELMLDKIYPQALDTAKIEPSGPGKLDEIISTNPPKFTFLIPQKPEVVLSDYKSIRKEYNLDEVSDDEVSNVIHRLQVNNAVAEPVENRPAGNNDLVAITISAQLVKPDDGEIAELINDQSLEVVIDPEDKLEDDPFPFPGFSKELIGLKTGDGKTISYTYPEDSTLERLRGKEVQFQVNVKEIKNLVLPELTDEFAQNLGEFGSFSDLSGKIKENITEEKRSAYEKRYFGELIESIVTQSSVKYPPHMLEDEVQQVLSSVEQNLMRRKMDLPTFLKTINQDKDTYIENTIKPIAEKNLKQALVLREIIRVENIEVSEDELKPAIAEVMGNISQLPGFEKLSRKKQSEGFMAMSYDTANRLLNDKLISRLKDYATGKMNSEDLPQHTTGYTSDQSVDSKTEV